MSSGVATLGHAGACAPVDIEASVISVYYYSCYYSRVFNIIHVITVECVVNHVLTRGVYK